MLKRLIFNNTAFITPRYLNTVVNVYNVKYHKCYVIVARL